MRAIHRCTELPGKNVIEADAPYTMVNFQNHIPSQRLSSTIVSVALTPRRLVLVLLQLKDNPVWITGKRPLHQFAGPPTTTPPLSSRR
ncbi:hypothetical protein GJAV_G00035310 [Gymnothorax javanicus]|nr:hypothetical protein GJAV_G00035310 [Gymnothorax javanicus]